MIFKHASILFFTLVVLSHAVMAEKPAPTHANVSYGTHERNVFDIWITPSDNPTPLVIYIHGGGFRKGDKNTITEDSLKQFQEAGLSVAAIHYRLSGTGPYPIMMKDAARSLQTIRSRAKEWNLDADKVACYGGSAGAGISLWLGFHEDLADPKSDDPISRQSTRITAVATRNGQSTYDLRDFRKIFNVPDLPAEEALFPMFAVTDATGWNDPHVHELMEDASPINHLTKDDVPVYMNYTRGNLFVNRETESGVWVHHVKLGLHLQKAMKSLGMECSVVSPEHPETRYGSFEAFLIEKLTNSSTAQQPKPPTAKAPEIQIDRLAWLTGSWQGAVNGGLLEETWLPPKADTISALVRFTKDGRTEFVEIIKIEKVGNSFELRLQLYDPPMRPRSDKPHVFKLSKIEKNKITFQGISEGSHRKLSYERVAQDHFIIRFQTFEGRDVKINLSSPPRNTFTF